MANKVLLVSPFSRTKVGGIGTWTQNLLEHNYKKDDENVLIHFNTAFSFKPNILNKYNRILYGIIDSFLVINIFLVKLISSKPDTIHYTSSASYALIKDYIVILISKLFRKKFIIHWHFGRISDILDQNGFECKIFNLVARKADLNIVLDQSSCHNMIKNKINNVVQIPNPLPPGILEFSSLDTHHKAKTEYSFILFVGHIIQTKGIFELIKAYCNIDTFAKLVLIGPVSEIVKNDVNKVVSGCKKEIVWVGEIERTKVWDYMRSAELLCLPSYSEGFPYVILEAMAIGCPVVATRVGAVEEMILSSDIGPAGISIDPKNTNQISSAINYLLNNEDKRDEYGLNGIKRVQNKYIMDKIYPLYSNTW